MEEISRIQHEKLISILQQKVTSTTFKITLRFEKHLSKRFEEALLLARKQDTFLEEEIVGSVRYYVSFLPKDVDRFFEIFERVKEKESTTLFLNNKRIPFIQDLWLFLMWFYRVR